MKALLLTVASSIVLAGHPVWAQAPETAPAPAPPQDQAPAAPLVQPPFPVAAKIAYVNIQLVASESVEGKAATDKVGALNQSKLEELQVMNTELQTAQQKLEQEITVLSVTARAEQQKQIERMQVDIQRFTEDAQAEVQGLQVDLQEEFQQKLMPVIAQVASERELYMVFSQLDSGLVWADTGLDITSDVIRRFDEVIASGGASSQSAASPQPPPPGP